MSVDVETAVATGLPWPTTGSTEQPRQGGRHRWDKGGPLDNLGRRIVTNPVGVDYNPLAGAVRTNLAPHHWSDPDRILPAPEGELTGRMDTAAVLAERAAEQPVVEIDPHDGPDTYGEDPWAKARARRETTTGSVLAEMRDQLGDPAAVVADIFTAAGCPMPDTTTPGGDQ
ncbi:hypothetical protein ABZ777_32405 [Micromonospora parva]|uniref:hypothetical protein n=1 Tax=Micromonospora parva TaxID=1464048 RepID=UPI0033C3E5EB